MKAKIPEKRDRKFQSFLDSPETTASIDSPNTIIVNNPKRSGKCEVSNGSLCRNRFLPTQGVTKSMQSSIAHKINLKGAGKAKEIDQQNTPDRTQ